MSFIAAKIETGDVFRVKQAFQASGVMVRVGQIVRIDSVDTICDPDARRYELLIRLTPTDPPGGTILWSRMHPLEQNYVDQILEKMQG